MIQFFFTVIRIFFGTEEKNDLFCLTNKIKQKLEVKKLMSNLVNLEVKKKTDPLKLREVDKNQAK